MHVIALQGARSTWSPFLQALPERTLSPILWSDEELDQLMGSPVVGEARDRRAALQSEWATLNEKIAADISQYPPGACTSLATPSNIGFCTLNTCQMHVIRRCTA